MKNSFLLAFVLFFSMTAASAQKTPAQWLRYPAISPNGQTICFSARGDLYLVPANGGEAIPLTIHESYDYMPVWSPDGKQIAFASDRFGNFDVFVVDVDQGEPQRLTFYSGNEKPWSFSPDGKKVLFSASIEDDPENIMFPSGAITELYCVNTENKGLERILTTPAEEIAFAEDANTFYYQDRKGYENIWRKHHTSSVTRDIRKYDRKTRKHSKITNFEGEDRDPVFLNDTLYFLSERSGSMNVWMLPTTTNGTPAQRTFFEKHPVRFLSIAQDGTLCFSYNGGVYTLGTKATEPVLLDVKMRLRNQENQTVYKKHTNGSSEMIANPEGTEIAFIVRGDVFVTSADYKTTKQITKTPGQERSLSFSPDGRSLLYASERNDGWNIYCTSLQRADEPGFASATLLKEEPLVVREEDCFQPAYSPDGKEIAFLEERTTLKVKNLESGNERTVLDGSLNYSYSDGDQHFEWSPDGKWLLATFSPNHLFLLDIALVKADGSEKPFNLTKSGYSDNRPKWVLDGKAMLWFSDRSGLRSHGSWGAQSDVYVMFLTKDGWKEFNLSKEEKELKEKLEKEKNKEKKKSKEDKKKDKKKKKDEKVEDSLKVEIDYAGLEDRVKRLTINSSSLSDAVLSLDGKKLFYLARFEKGYDLWVHDLVDNKTTLLMKLNGGGGSMQLDKSGKNLFLYSGGSIYKIPVSASKPSKKSVNFSAEQSLDLQAERAYLYDHVWRQCQKKFYDTAMHQVDWKFYGDNYRQFLPFINNNYDFAEMLSELLGELNASHTGSGYRHSDKQGDKTATLGVFVDFNYQGPGIKIADIIDESPLAYSDNIKAGAIILRINGETVDSYADYIRLMNHQEGKNILLEVSNNKLVDTLTVKPISKRAESHLLYKRWVKRQRELTDSLSGGRIGYVHVAGMNSNSFRQFYSDVLGRNHEKEAIIVDTRFNGGGWLHDDLVTLLSGEPYVQFAPRGQKFGFDPMNKWIKPSAVLVSEGNYSDAHGFPYAYKTLGIGKIIGMPVPGTMTAVWWETLQDPTLYFGIPEVGTLDMNGHYLENQQLEPDVVIDNEYEIVSEGTDQQLSKAVEVLLKEIDQSKK